MCILYIKHKIVLYVYTQNCLNFDIKFLSEVLILYLDFIKFTVEMVDAYIQVAANILELFKY